MADVSVIIPAYNAAKTVERTIQSVLASTIPVDLFVVDDGSTDGTGDLLDRMEKELAPANGSRLVVMHQPNSGAYQARLNALKKIKTPHFGFVDADDAVDPKMYEKMLAAMERENLDAVQCGYALGRVERVDGEGGLTTLEGKELTRYKFGYLVNPKVSCFIWDKLYRNQYDFDSFYKAKNERELSDWLHLIVEEGQDPRMKQRISASKNACVFGNHASRQIVDWLEQDVLCIGDKVGTVLGGV